MPLQLTDGITYDSPTGDMLNCTEGIIDGLKRVIFFGAYGSSIKSSINLLMTTPRQTRNYQRVFFRQMFSVRNFVDKIITNGMLV
jgi:hypothetical protein